MSCLNAVLRGRKQLCQHLVKSRESNPVRGTSLAFLMAAASGKDLMQLL